MVDRIKKNLSLVDNVDIPNYIFNFLESYDNFSSFSDFHKSLVEYFGDSDKLPSLNESMLYYDLIKFQRLADGKYSLIVELTDKLNRLRDDPESSREEIFRVEKCLEKNERDYHQILKDILKYTNDGVNRSTPRKVESKITVVKPSDIAKMIKSSGRVIDAEYSKD